MQEMCVQFLGWEDPLQEEMATHSRILVWSIPWTEVPVQLQSMGLQRDVTEHTHTLQQKFLLEPCLRCTWCDLGADEDSSVQQIHWHSLKQAYCPYYITPHVKSHLRWWESSRQADLGEWLPEWEHFPGLSSTGKWGWAGRMGTPKSGGDK